MPQQTNGITRQLCHPCQSSCRSKPVQHVALKPDAFTKSGVRQIGWLLKHLQRRRLHWQGKLILPFGCDVIDGITIKKPTVKSRRNISDPWSLVWSVWRDHRFISSANVHHFLLRLKRIWWYHFWCAGPTDGWCRAHRWMTFDKFEHDGVCEYIYDGKNLNLPWIECRWIVAQGLVWLL